MRFYLQPGGLNREAQHCARLAGVMASPARDVVPVGTVEWTAIYAAEVGVVLPDWQTYPPELLPWMGRQVRVGRYADAQPHEFCKPLTRLKAFAGALWADVDEVVSPDEPVWIAEPVSFTAEWRCYILNRAIVGIGQYGEGDDEEPDLAHVASMLAAWQGPAGWALDVGRLADGRQVLVEVNDGWALGFYTGCKREAYLRVISARWAEIAGTGAT